MSTFGGFMPEFPNIRVDFFRPIPDRRPPLACFLSHIHSDHLAGLETLKSPFVYCSAATKEILLRLERYPHRLNFALGILESRKQQYKHLKNILKPIPLQTPTRIELEPDNVIQVTLFDANHCTGAVMFLIENDNKAVLYTGDIRSEIWFVNSLVRNPFLIEYTSGLKRLDCIYLDTSNTGPATFPAKADGIKELLTKVSKYPADTVFHFTAWTFGYEEVWMALSRALKSQIHVDNYKLKLYQSLSVDSSQSGSFLAHDGPALAGYQCGNTPQLGCLTNDINVRIHSCEKGMHCKNVNDKTVFIRPIVGRTRGGVDIEAVGVGGGGGDLTRRAELQLDNNYMIDQFLGLFANTDDLVFQDIKRMLSEALQSSRQSLSLDGMGLDHEQDEFRLDALTKAMAQSVSDKRRESVSESLEGQDKILPRVITFPYSRHSSYEELRHLVRIFDPKDVYPCTVDKKNWHEGVSMERLFGPECTATYFRHDDEMRQLREPLELSGPQSQTTVSRSSQVETSPSQRIVPSPQRRLTIKRNSEGRLRSFDAEGNEVLFNVPNALPPQRTDDLSNVPIARPPQKNHALVTSPSIPTATPPRELFAASPGSESQSLRRKAILDGLREGRDKRPRLNFDGPGDLPDSIPEESEIGLSIPASSPGIPELLGSEDETDEPKHYWDAVDEVIRCGHCGHELWSPIGDCTGCGSGEPSYLEVWEPEGGPEPGYAYNDVDSESLSSEIRNEVLGDYLDNESSAYDSFDEESAEKKHEEYELNSFIDDESEASNAEEESSDEEIDCEQKLAQLQATHRELIEDYLQLADQHDELRRDVLGSDYDSETDMDVYDEDGLIIVDVNPPDPVLSELVLSHAQGESQSQITPERVQGRVEAARAAIDQSWHNLSLTSTVVGEHTFAEIEL